MNEKKDTREPKPRSERPEETRNLPLEDLALKVTAQYFGEVLLPYLGITEKLSIAMPTEQVELRVIHLFEDFNYQLADKEEWLHLEFESDSIKTDDLRRFREYESTTSRTYHVGVTTCVICSSEVKEIKTTLTEGINTYRVQVIRLKDRDADQLFAKLFEKKRNREPLTRSDLIPLLLSPLMSGEMAQKDRIMQGLELLGSEQAEVPEEELDRMSAVLYTLANKFLGVEELKTVKERISMTILGQMLMEDGIEKGREQGIEQGIEQGKEIGIEQGKEMGIAAMISDNMEEQIPEERILSKLIKHFSLDEQAARDYLKKYGSQASERD